jgi:formylglycine-generating enzyme required for sulfatase activity
MSDLIPTIHIPGGTFLMGSVTGDGREKPQHKVTLDSFKLGINPVTQRQWETVVQRHPDAIGMELEAKPWFFKHKGSESPVENVSWEQAVEFCKRLSTLHRMVLYRLPTEAEWEYACCLHSAKLEGMIGSVFQWCEDDWFPCYLGAPTDGTARIAEEDAKYRVARGGTWSFSANGQPATATQRNRIRAYNRNCFVGFRVACNL